MRTLGWLIVFFTNCLVIATFAPRVLEADYVAFTVLAVLASIMVLLVLVRFNRLPTWGYAAMKLLCWAVPILTLIASLDSGIISGQEVYSLIFAGLLGWGSWRVFLLFYPSLTNRPSRTR